MGAARIPARLHEALAVYFKLFHAQSSRISQVPPLLKSKVATIVLASEDRTATKSLFRAERWRLGNRREHSS
jgi:hypothetical protein